MAEKTLDLFELIQKKIGCDNISDLPFITKSSPAILIHALNSIRPDEFPLKQWNDALNYFIQAPAQNTIEKAYTRLLSALSAADKAR